MSTNHHIPAHDQVYQVDVRHTALFILVLLLMMGTMISFPVRSLLGAWQYHEAIALLDDPSTEYRDVSAINQESLHYYGIALGILQKAADLKPAKSRYEKTLADIYQRIGTWTEVMEDLQAPVPGGVLSSHAAYERSLNHLRSAIDQEPANADYHLALGKLYAAREQTRDQADNELRIAAACHPTSPGLRTAVAMQYLLLGMRDQAFAHAKILAQIDDSYFVWDPLSGSSRLGRRTPELVAHLSRSYLMQAFEIAWRASYEKSDDVRRIVPDNPFALETFRIFMEGKGVDE